VETGALQKPHAARAGGPLSGPFAVAREGA